MSGGGFEDRERNDDGGVDSGAACNTADSFGIEDRDGDGGKEMDDDGVDSGAIYNTADS